MAKTARMRTIPATRRSRSGEEPERLTEKRLGDGSGKSFFSGLERERRGTGWMNCSVRTAHPCPIYSRRSLSRKFPDLGSEISGPRKFPALFPVQNTIYPVPSLETDLVRKLTESSEISGLGSEISGPRKFPALFPVQIQQSAVPNLKRT